MRTTAPRSSRIGRKNPSPPPLSLLSLRASVLLPPPDVAPLLLLFVGALAQAPLVDAIDISRDITRRRRFVGLVRRDRATREFITRFCRRSVKSRTGAANKSAVVKLYVTTP